MRQSELYINYPCGRRTNVDFHLPSIMAENQTYIFGYRHNERASVFALTKSVQIDLHAFICIFDFNRFVHKTKEILAPDKHRLGPIVTVTERVYVFYVVVPSIVCMGSSLLQIKQQMRHPPAAYVESQGALSHPLYIVHINYYTLYSRTNAGVQLIINYVLRCRNSLCTICACVRVHASVYCI